MSINSKTFCLAPWVHATVETDATMIPCCASRMKSNITYENYITWWNGDSMRGLRKDLANGNKNINCIGCWSQEDLGKGESQRINYNNLFNKYADYDQIRNAEANDYVSTSEPVTWDIKLGNLCNIKCVMCNADFSDKIDKEIKQHATLIEQKFPGKLIPTYSAYQNWTETNTAREFLAHIFSNSKWIKLEGGEPLSQKNVRDILDNLSDTNLSIITNGTILDDRIYNALAKFPRVEISVSVESVSHANDIIRYGSDWETVRTNLLRLKELPNVDIQINHVLQITSVFYLVDVLKFCEEHNIKMLILELFTPKYLSLAACPTEYIEQMIAEVEKIEIKQSKNQYIKKYLINSLAKTKYSQELNDEFYRYVDLLDRMRLKKFSSVLKFKEQAK